MATQFIVATRWLFSAILLCLLLWPEAFAQSTIQLGNASYTLRPHPRVWLDGPSGSLTSALSDRSQTGRANSANPVYEAMLSRTTSFVNSGYTSPSADYNKGDSYSKFSLCALRWLADGDSACLAAAKYGLLNLENIVGGNFGCDTSQQYCNGRDDDTDYVRLFLPAAAMAYSAIRNQLTPTERVLIANKFLNDNDQAHNGIDTVQCTNQGSGAWFPGNCGVIWFAKHHNGAPPLIPGQESHYTTDYPFGNYFVNDQGNLTHTALVAYISVGLAFADEDPRALRLLQQSYNYYLAHQYRYARATWTGFTQAGALYSPGRSHWFASLIAIMLRNSLQNGPDLIQGEYIKKQLPYYYFTALPDNPTEGLTFQDIYGARFDHYGIRALWPALWLFANSSEGQFANYFARVTRGDFDAQNLGYNQGSYLPYSYVFTDPAHPSRSLSQSSTQYLFRNTDYNLCPSLGLDCSQYNDSAYTHVISRTGWSANDSLVLLQSSFNDVSDHSGTGNWGSVHIYRRGYLLSGESRDANGNRGDDNLIELGGGDNWVSPGLPAYANVVRWAGANPTGDAQSRYTYALSDMTRAYKASQNALRVHRHFVHLKKPGTQDYLVWFDDIATGTPGMKRAILRYTLNGRPSSSALSISGGANGGTVSNTQANSKLLTAVLPTAGVNTALLAAGAAGTYTVPVHICAENPAAAGSCSSSGTTAEWLVVHKPSINLGDTLPPIDQPGAANFRVVQIKDSSSPKVFAVAPGGATHSSFSVNTSHSGVAQYLVAGLAPGSYRVTLNGATVLDSIPVIAGDNSLYFESASGAISVSSGAVFDTMPPAAPENLRGE